MLESRITHSPPLHHPLSAVSHEPSTSVSELQARLKTEIALGKKQEKRLADTSRYVDAMLVLVGQKDGWRNRELELENQVMELEEKVTALGAENAGLRRELRESTS